VDAHRRVLGERDPVHPGGGKKGVYTERKIKYNKIRD
jgi:hypothetical protein